MLFIRLNKTATNVENGRSERTTVPDPDPEIRRGWGQSFRPFDKWGSGLQINFFRTFGASVWSKNDQPLY